MRAEDLTKTLDLTVLAPDTAAADIDRACAEARELHFAALCADGRFVPQVADLLRGCDVKTCAVLDFPGGASTTAERMRIAEKLGIRVHVWTVDDREDQKTQWNLGVHGVMSDDPLALQAVTKELGRTDKGL